MSTAIRFPVDTRLKEAGLRRTPVRLAVLKILDASKTPLDATTIAAKVAEPIDTVTVYRTLNTFTRKKLVHRVSSESGWRYAIGRPDAKPIHQHPHFVCEECGNVECVKESSIPGNLLGSLKLGHRYIVSYAEVVLHGVCSKCR
jgi:Fur family transcriptional regulator, ferric uptake regulator